MAVATSLSPPQSGIIRLDRCSDSYFIAKSSAGNNQWQLTVNNAGITYQPGDDPDIGIDASPPLAVQLWR